MNCISSCGLICVKNKQNIEFVVCKIEYILNDNGKFKYIFTPYYDVIDLLDEDVFMGIPGLDLSLRKKLYIRENITPVFISERVPSENREDYYELLSEVKMDYMDPIEYLCKTINVYSGDNLYVKPFEERKVVSLEESAKKSNSFGVIKIILDSVSHGDTIYLNNKKINGSELFETLLFIYNRSFNELKAKQKEGIRVAKENGTYKGRKPIYVDELLFKEQMEQVDKEIITVKIAANNLGISIDKYYRTKKKIKK